MRFLPFPKWDYHFHAYLPAHVVYAHAARQRVFRGIFQAVEMRLVGGIEQVVGNDEQFTNLSAPAAGYLTTKAGIERPLRKGKRLEDVCLLF